MNEYIKKYIPEPVKRFKRNICRRTDLITKWIKDLMACLYVWQGKLPPDSIDKQLDAKLYNDIPEKCEKTGVICILDGNMFHGGLTDRLRGILSAYRESKRLDLPFYVMWDSPFDLTDFLVPASFDWRISHKEISRSRLNSKIVVADDLSDFQSLMRLRAAFHHPKPQIHLYTNADSARGEYASLYRELFKPSEKLQSEINRHILFLSNEYIAFTFRFIGLLGDFTDWKECLLTDQQQFYLMKKARDEFIKLTTNDYDGYKILVTSDSKRFLEFIKDSDPRIYIIPGDIKHIDIDRNCGMEVWTKTFIDQQLLMGARKVIRMRTGEMYAAGFPRFAAEVGGVEFIDYKF